MPAPRNNGLESRLALPHYHTKVAAGLTHSPTEFTKHRVRVSYWGVGEATEDHDVGGERFGALH